MEASLQHCVRLGCQDEVQAGPRSGAPGQPFVDKVYRLGRVGPRHAGNALGIAENMIGDRHAADDVLQAHDVVAVQDLVDGRLQIRTPQPHDLLFLRVARVIDLHQEQKAIELGLG